MYREKYQQLVTGIRPVRAQEKFWRDESGYLDLINRLFPAGRREGDFWRLGADGDEGRRLAFNILTGKWTDFGDDEAGADLNKATGIVSFIFYLEGWDGLRRLAQSEDLTFDWAIYNGAAPDDRIAYQWAMKRSFVVAGKWEYRDLDGTYLGTRVRFEDKKGQKEFRLLTYRTRRVMHDAGNNRHEFPEGWRLDGDWGEIDPLYGLEKLTSSEAPLLFVEGEKTAEAGQLLVDDNFCVMTWGGGAGTKIAKAAWDLIPRNRDKYYWPDKDDPGRKTIPKMVELFPSLRMVDVWNIGELGKKDDMADVQDSTWALEQLTRTIYASSLISKTSPTMNYTYVVKTEEFIDMTTGHRLSPKALSRKHAHEVEDLDEELLSDARTDKVYSLTFWPGKPRIVDEMDERGNPVRKINLWHESGCEPISGEFPFFSDHLNRLIPDENVRNHVLDYLAFIVQHPGEKIHYALLIMGRQGVGKSYLVQVLRYLLGQTNVREVTDDNLTSAFNGWIEDAQVIVVEEVMAGGRRETTNKLKPIITSPTLHINNKGIKGYDVSNRVNMLLFSNEDDPLVLDDDDRRFLVYKTPMSKQPKIYYIHLFESLVDEASALRAHLEARDLSEFNPKGEAPMTESKKELINTSESTTLSNLRMYLESRRTPFDRDVVSIVDVCDWIRLNLRGATRFDSTPKSVRTMLMKIGAKTLGVQDTNGEPSEMWCLRNFGNFGL